MHFRSDEIADRIWWGGSATPKVRLIASHSRYSRTERSPNVRRHFGGERHRRRQTPGHIGSAIRKHVHALEEAGLAHVSWAGRESVWELRPNRLADVQRCLDQISRQWYAALDRLRALVEK
jgi:hypothetical protein